ncbi:MAG: rod shape-determining protein RodA [Actinobacteria bacterium]|nr:rod shape-determining protein RodA [Actinomycetota bacterium]MEC7810481.1 FtsW/RodA/SpoVE family cell cycle protein [Actinomycetota bacterium]MED5276500.1 FtsW/RodA/SpoVE family cell cycle protein [Actinomycetota bacterium]|tara:strand:+ start:1113 stop:2246 length:1134 start_codon:yes stop_codon:yes gene_type:complete
MVDIRTPNFGKIKIVRHVDFSIPILALTLSGIGLLMIYSATRKPFDLIDTNEILHVQKQAIFLLIGVIGMFVVAAIGHKRLQRLTPLIYLVVIGLLFSVLFLGVEKKGTKGWFEFGIYQFQPSEYCKIGIVVVLAFLLSGSETISRGRLLLTLVAAGLPIVAILAQPDLGTILVYGAITAGMVVAAGIKGRYLFILFLLLLTGVVAVFESETLEDYQVARLLVFVNDDESTSASYNLEQAQIAIGNGGITGSGLFEGTQNKSDLVPEQQTDFIFTVIAEETGFLGSVLVLGLIGLLLFRIWRIGRLAEDNFGLLISVGVFCMILFQTFQSVGMSTGIMPITGIPLPLISYGGSSIVSTFLGLGLVESVHMRRHERSN